MPALQRQTWQLTTTILMKMACRLSSNAGAELVLLQLQPECSPATSAQQQVYNCYAGSKADKFSHGAVQGRRLTKSQCSLVQPASPLCIDCASSVSACICDELQSTTTPSYTLSRGTEALLAYVLMNHMGGGILSHSDSAIRAPRVSSPTVEGRTV